MSTCQNLPSSCCGSAPPQRQLHENAVAVLKVSSLYLRRMETVLSVSHRPFPRLGPFPVDRHHDVSPWETFPFKMIVLKLPLVHLGPRKTVSQGSSSMMPCVETFPSRLAVLKSLQLYLRSREPFPFGLQWLLVVSGNVSRPDGRT